MSGPLSRKELVMAEAGLITLIGALVAITNPFGPGEMALGARLAYWIIGLLAGWIIVRLLAEIGAATARLIGLSYLWGYALAIPLGGAMIAWAVLWWRGGSELAFGETFSRVWPSTIIVGLGFFGLFYVIYARSARAEEATALAAAVEASPSKEAQEQTTGASATPLHDRLPTGFPPILALSVEDHYVRAHAENRSEMVLMTLAEAVKLMPEDCGVRVHRSWWVARSAVQGHRRDGRDVKLVLADGLAVPVSRDRVKGLREAGWLI